MATTFTNTPVADVKVGAIILGDPAASIECEVLRIDEGEDRRIGIPLIRLWCRRVDGGVGDNNGANEGYVSFGHTGLVKVVRP